MGQLKSTDDPKPSDLGYLYRYEIEIIHGNIGNTIFDQVNLKLRTYSIIKKTPKGYWISQGGVWKKWVSKDGLRRFACDEKRTALINFQARYKKRLKILQSQTNNTMAGLVKAKVLYQTEYNFNSQYDDYI